MGRQIEKRYDHYDYSAPGHAVSTAANICEASPDGDIPDKTKGGSGAVFILDFGPIYKTMCVAPIDSAQRNPLQVCENILA